MGAASFFQPGSSHLHILNIWHLTNPTTRQKMFFLSNHNDYQDGLTYTFPTFDIWQIQHQNDICRSVQRGFSCNIRMKSSGDGKGWKGWWRTRDLMHGLAGRKWECCCCCGIVVAVLWLLLWWWWGCQHPLISSSPPWQTLGGREVGRIQVFIDWSKGNPVIYSG